MTPPARDMKVGPCLYRLRWAVLAGWASAVAGLGLLAGRLDPAANEPESFLP